MRKTIRRWKREWERELYLPQEWIEDRERCRAAGIPEQVEFATKPEGAADDRAGAGRGHALRLGVGDAAYGRDSKLRRCLEARQQAFALAVASEQRLWWPDFQQQRVDRIAPDLPRRAWKRLFRCNVSNNSCSVRISLRVAAIFNGDISTLCDVAGKHQPSQPWRWYALAMRRWFASILLLLTALLPLQPLLASAQSDAGLPACCRRNGAHRCVMLRGMAMTDSGTQSSVRPSPCPLWKLAINPAVVAVAVAPPALPSQPAIAENIVISASPFHFVYPARSHPARAPPSELLLIPELDA